MTPEERAAMIAHDARVKALADRMPDKALWCAVCAIGYRAGDYIGLQRRHDGPGEPKAQES
jgi:hypothetical protein